MNLTNSNLEVFLNKAIIYVKKVLQDANLLIHLQPQNHGVWRSWLAYLHGVQVVVRSSRITPTRKILKVIDFRDFCF